MMRRLWIALVIAVFAAPAWAGRVQPNDRVTTHLIVRAEPGKAPVGALAPGESARLLATVPYWYQVELDNGVRGYVSKAWSRVVPEAAAASLIRLGSWNIKKLGHGSSKDYALVAQVIKDHFDIMAVVEAMQKGGGHPGYDQLMTALGSGWTGLVTDSPRPDTGSGSAEYYAIVYRPERIQQCQGWTGLRYHTDNSGGPSGVGNDVFSREPAFGCFRVIGAGGGFDFILAAYHARWAEGDIEEIQSEVRHLGEVFADMTASVPGERDLLISGDFNLTPADLGEAIGREVPTSGEGSTLNGQGQRTTNLYDHLIVFDPQATQEMVGSAKVLDVRNVAATPRAYFKTVSDHLPIMARFRPGPDDD